MRPKKVAPNLADEQLSAAADKAADQLWKDLHGVAEYDPVRNPFGVPNNKKGKVVKNNAVAESRRLPDGMSPVTAYVRSLDGDYRTTQEVADELEVSTQLVRKLARQRVTQAPSYVAPFGRIKVHLYTQEDIQALKDYLSLRRVVHRRDEL